LKHFQAGGTNKIAKRDFSLNGLNRILEFFGGERLDDRQVPIAAAAATA